MNRFQPDTTGTFEITYADETADAKLHFSTELVASDPAHGTRAETLAEEEEMTAFIHSIFDDVPDGWQHAINAVHVMIVEYLAPLSARNDTVGVS